MPEFLDGIVEHVNRIKVLVDIDRPSLRLVNFDKGEEHVKPITFLGAFCCAPAGVDLDKRVPVVFVRTDRPDLHQRFPLELRYGQNIDAVVLGMGANKLHEGYLPAEIESDPQAVVSSRNFEPDALAVQYHRQAVNNQNFTANAPLAPIDIAAETPLGQSRRTPVGYLYPGPEHRAWVVIFWSDRL